MRFRAGITGVLKRIYEAQLFGNGYITMARGVLRTEP